MAKGIAGTCYLKVDGEQLSVSSNSISIQSAEVKREAVMGLPDIRRKRLPRLFRGHSMLRRISR